MEHFVKVCPKCNDEWARCRCPSLNKYVIKELCPACIKNQDKVVEDGKNWKIK